MSRSAAELVTWRHFGGRETPIRSVAPSAFLHPLHECAQRNGAINRTTRELYIVQFYFPPYPAHARCCCHVKQPQPLGLFRCCGQLTNSIFVWRCFLPNYSFLLSSVCLVTSITSMMLRSMIHCFPSSEQDGQSKRSVNASSAGYKESSSAWQELT